MKANTNDHAAHAGTTKTGERPNLYQSYTYADVQAIIDHARQARSEAMTQALTGAFRAVGQALATIGTGLGHGAATALRTLRTRIGHIKTGHIKTGHRAVSHGA